MQQDSQTYLARRAFGIFFVAISIAVGVATILSEVVFVKRAPLYYYPIIWIASFVVTFGVSLW